MNKDYKKKGYSKTSKTIIGIITAFIISLIIISIISFYQYSEKTERYDNYEALFVITINYYDPMLGEVTDSFYWKNNTPMPQKAQDCMKNPVCELRYDRIDS